MQAFLMVFIGGGLGSICRYVIAQVLQPCELAFPLATFIANALACLLLGALVGISLKNGIGTSAKLLLMTGFCGGFSTFSTFSGETFQLMESGNLVYALANIGLSVTACLICILIGLKLVI